MTAKEIDMKAVRCLVILALATLLCSATSAQANPITFSLLPPNGAIAGAPGSTIGWGYSISNNSALWLEVSGLGADPFQHATADASLFDFPILAPFATWTVAYDPANFAGLFQITWNASAPVGFTNSGLFTLSGNFFDADPLAGGLFVDFAPTQSAAYSASVAAAVPEPGTLGLVAMGVGLTGFVRRRRKASR
jgi:hypothetical protein